MREAGGGVSATTYGPIFTTTAEDIKSCGHVPWTGINVRYIRYLHLYGTSAEGATDVQRTSADSQHKLPVRADGVRAKRANRAPLSRGFSSVCTPKPGGKRTALVSPLHKVNLGSFKPFGSTGLLAHRGEMIERDHN